MRPQKDIPNNFPPHVAMALCLLIAFSLVLAACGGGTASSTNQQANTAILQVNMGDAPSDRLVAFAMTLNSMTFTNSAGSSVPVMSPAATMEMTHLMGTMQPVSLMEIPQGTYTGATITMGNIGIVYMNPLERSDDPANDRGSRDSERGFLVNADAWV